MGLIRDAYYRVRYALHNHTHAGGTSGAPIAHSALSGVTADQHHTQAHAHASHTGIGADDHHAQSHSHASHTGIGADDHHAQSHAHGSHTGIGANDHHAQAHHAAHEPTGADPMAVDAAAGTGSLRTLGTGALQAAAGNHSQFVNRGDPAAYDWVEIGTKAVLNTDGTWRDLDCLAKVPACAGAKAIVFALMVADNLTGQSFNLRCNGNANAFAYVGANTNVANIQIYTCVVVPCDANQVVEYIGSNTAWSSIALTIMGWIY